MYEFTDVQRGCKEISVRCAIQCALELAMLHWKGEDAAEQNVTIHGLALGFSMPHPMCCVCTLPVT